MRPLRMPRDLRLLPGRQIGIKIGKRLLRLGFEPGQFLANSNGVTLSRELAEFQNLGFEFGNRFFKIEIASHCRRRGYAKDRTRLGAAPKFPSWRPKERKFANRNQRQLHYRPVVLQERGNSLFCAAKSRTRTGGALGLKAAPR
jgi:hypothetical protein